MVNDDQDVKKKKTVQPRPTGIVIREGGSMNQKAGVDLVNVGAKAVDILTPRSDVKKH